MTYLSLKPLSQPAGWLLGIGAGLVAIHLTLVSQAQQEELLWTSILFWIAVGGLVWPRRSQLSLESNGVSIGLGIAIISLILVKSHWATGRADTFLRIMPLLSGFGLVLLASGWYQLQKYWQELLILALLIPHPGWLSHLYDLSEVTAHFAAILLWCFGFDAHNQGPIIALSNGFVGVNPGCSGYSSMMQLFGLSIIFLFMFPLSCWQRWLAPPVAITIAFVINGIRVAIMSVLAVEANRSGFLYWHNGEGSFIFSLISVSLFGVFCYFLIEYNRQQNLKNRGNES